MNAIFPAARSADCSNDPTFLASGAAVGTAGISAKASPGRVYKFRVQNKGAAVVWAMLFNKATAPVNTDVPLARVPVPITAGAAEIDYGQFGRPFALGIGIAFSSTPDTLTLLAGADCHYEVMFK